MPAKPRITAESQPGEPAASNGLLDRRTLLRAGVIAAGVASQTITVAITITGRLVLVTLFVVALVAAIACSGSASTSAIVYRSCSDWNR